MEFEAPSRLGGPGKRRKLPQRGPGAEPRRKTIFLLSERVSERLLLQRLLKINVVHSRPLVEKNVFAQCVTEATALVTTL